MKRYHACLITVTLTLLASGCTAAEQDRRYRVFYGETAQALVPGYRLPEAAQIGPLWVMVESRLWETRDGSGETKSEFWTSGDFNGDGTMDYAYILDEKATDIHVLFAVMSTSAGYEALELERGFEWGTWLRTRPPGRYATEGAGDGPEFEAPNQSIDFFQFKGPTSTFVWNSTAASFDRFRPSRSDP